MSLGLGRVSRCSAENKAFQKGAADWDDFSAPGLCALSL